MSRSRNYIFVLNNYTEEQVESISNLCDNRVTFVAFSREVGASGTPHLQGYLHHKNQLYFDSIRSWYPWHVEVMKGNFAQNETYCSKQSALEKFGVEPMNIKASTSKAAKDRWDLAKAGKFEELAPEYIKTYEYIYNKFRKVEELKEFDFIWVYGESGCGKSRWAHDTFPIHYKKSWNQWWDGYMGEDVIIFDDMSPKHTTYLEDYIKNWFDWYPFKANVKGGMMTIRPKTMVVTSQYTIEEVFPDRKTFMAMDRRFVYRYSYNPVYRCMGWELGYNRENKNELEELIKLT